VNADVLLFPPSEPSVTENLQPARAEMPPGQR